MSKEIILKVEDAEVIKGFKLEPGNYIMTVQPNGVLSHDQLNSVIGKLTRQGIFIHVLTATPNTYNLMSIKEPQPVESKEK